MYSASGRPIGRVEQSHGDILSDGGSCGARAVLPNCQADFSAMRRGEESQTNRALAQSPIAEPAQTSTERETSPGIAGGRDETESEI